MEMYQRIKFLRKEILKINQEAFSKKINLSRSNFANIEVGTVKLTPRVVNDICNSFSVNIKWLEDGIEPIFIEQDNSAEIAKLYASLNEDNKKYLQGYIQRLLEEQSVLQKD